MIDHAEGPNPDPVFLFLLPLSPGGGVIYRDRDMILDVMQRLVVEVEDAQANRLREALREGVLSTDEAALLAARTMGDAQTPAQLLDTVANSGSVAPGIWLGRPLLLTGVLRASKEGVCLSGPTGVGAWLDFGSPNEISDQENDLEGQTLICLGAVRRWRGGIRIFVAALLT